jgi:hypothetical protein
MSVFHENIWFHLARYFDVDFAQRGPAALSSFLGFPEKEIFPILYDITPYVIRAKIPTTGFISENPEVRLSREELIALSLE